MKGAADRPGVIHVAADLVENLERLFIFLDRLLVFAGQVEHVAHGARALPGGVRIIDFAGDPRAGLGHALRLLQIDAGKNHHRVIERFHCLAAACVGLRSKESAALSFAGDAGQINDPLFDPEIRLLGHLKAQLCQDFLQPVQAAAADKTNGPRRQAKLLGNLVVGDRRLLIEQQLDQLSAPRREPFHGIADRLLFLNLLQHHGGRGNLFRQLLLHGVQLNVSLLLLLPVETLVRRHRDQP